MPRYLYNSRDAERLVADEGRAPQLEHEPYRSPWRRDYARVIHSAAFRRLQGKTQLFPNHESDFFRNRLTHSLEVAQVAKSIATRLNATAAQFTKQKIDTDIVETAALCHDLGHPPFGHNGEEALDECMADAGGFEGNAQTLRILAKLEKRQTKTRDKDRPVPVVGGEDQRAGLNLTYRTLASVLKYDNEIPERKRERARNGVQKGYYSTERSVVAEIKERIGGVHKARGTFKTLECSIMDLADDIAYSTYDLEDAFKAKFLSPLSMISASDELHKVVAKRVSESLDKYPIKLTPVQKRFTADNVVEVLLRLFAEIFGSTEEDIEDVVINPVASTIRSYKTSIALCDIGYFRTELTSHLVGRFIRGVELIENKANPALSTAYLHLETFKEVEVLKHFTFQALIMSPMLKVSEYRGKDIVKQIFGAIDKENGELLMPDDFQEMYRKLRLASDKKRVICDFIAGMTDKYAIEFHRRLYSTTPETIFKPL